MNAVLSPILEIRTIGEFRSACLEKLLESPSNQSVHDAVLDLYLETEKRIQNGWILSSVLTDASIHLKHL